MNFELREKLYNEMMDFENVMIALIDLGNDENPYA